MTPKIEGIALLLLFGTTLAFGYGRSGDLAHPSFRNSADKAEPFSIQVSSGLAVNVYEPFNTGVDVDRTIVIQNPGIDFDIVCGTHPFVSATSGPRFFIPPRKAFVTNGSYDIWCIAPPGVGGNSLPVIGVVEYETND